MNVDATLEASAQLAEGGQPSVCAIDDPAMAPKSVVALNAFAGDAVLDATALEVRAASRVVVPLVRMQLVGPAAWPASLACWVAGRVPMRTRPVRRARAPDNEEIEDQVTTLICQGTNSFWP